MRLGPEEPSDAVAHVDLRDNPAESVPGRSFQELFPGPCASGSRIKCIRIVHVSFSFVFSAGCWTCCRQVVSEGNCEGSFAWPRTSASLVVRECLQELLHAFQPLRFPRGSNLKV